MPWLTMSISKAVIQSISISTAAIAVATAVIIVVLAVMGVTRGAAITTIWITTVAVAITVTVATATINQQTLWWPLTAVEIVFFNFDSASHRFQGCNFRWKLTLACVWNILQFPWKVDSQCHLSHPKLRIYHLSNVDFSVEFDIQCKTSFASANILNVWKILWTSKRVNPTANLLSWSSHKSSFTTFSLGRGPAPTSRWNFMLSVTVAFVSHLASNLESD